MEKDVKIETTTNSRNKSRKPRQGKNKFMDKAKQIVAKEAASGVKAIGGAIVKGLVNDLVFSNHPEWYGGESLRATALVGGAAKVPANHLNIVFSLVQWESDPLNMLSTDMIFEELTSAIQLYDTYLGTTSGITPALMLDAIKKSLLATAWLYTALRTQNSRNVIPITSYNKTLEEMMAITRTPQMALSIIDDAAVAMSLDAMTVFLQNSIPSRPITIGVWSKYAWEAEVVAKASKLFSQPQIVQFCRYLYENYFVNNDTLGANAYYEFYPEKLTASFNIKTKTEAALASAMTAINANPYMHKFLELLGYSRCVDVESLTRDNSGLKTIVVSDHDFYASLLNRSAVAVTGQPLLLSNLTEDLGMTDDSVVEDVSIGEYISLMKMRIIGANPVTVTSIRKAGSGTFGQAFPQYSTDVMLTELSQGAGMAPANIASYKLTIDQTYVLSQALKSANFPSFLDVIGLEDLQDVSRPYVVTGETSLIPGNASLVIATSISSETMSIYGLDAKSVSDWELLDAVAKSNFLWGRNWRKAALTNLSQLNNMLNPK